MNPIDVIIPVFKGLQETCRGIESVLHNQQRASLEVVIVDDASPDPEIVSYLDQLGSKRQITLLRNETNLGFVHSVNRGISLHPDRDVVLLNSDAEVANDWLDRLMHSAYGDAKIGTVTPFSNNATICSYPYHGWTGGVPGTLGLEALDRLFSKTNAGRTIDLPTAVGFCMYIRRECLDSVGLFDAHTFGRGYGEENDFCMRASQAGWRNVLAGNVFVLHAGAVSFAAESISLSEISGKKLRDIHPDYARKVQEFILHDPASVLRETIHDARMAQSTDEARCLLKELLGELKKRKTEYEEKTSKLEQGLAFAQELVAERDETVSQLRQGLANAESLIVERDAEISRLRAGLSHAETLAFQRLHELNVIHEHWLWTYMDREIRQKF